MHSMLTLSTCLLATLTAAAVAAGEASEAIERELMRIENGAMERWRQGDPMGWVEIVAPEVTYVDPGLTKPILGRDEYSRYMEKLKGKIRYQGSEFVRPKVAIYGEVAVLTYNYQSTTQEADGTLKRGPLWNATEVYTRSDGAWRIIHTHWSFTRHVLPEQLELPLPVELGDKREEGVLGELLTLERAAMARWRRGDPKGFLEISAPEVTYFDSNTPERVTGLDGLTQLYRKYSGTVHYEAMEFIQPAVQVHGTAAVLSYRFLSTHLRADGSIERRTPWNCSEVYVKRAGAWKLVHTHWSLIGGRPANGTPPTLE